MVARTSTWTGSAEALDKWEAHVKTQVSGFVAGLPGNAGGVFFIDRAAGTALTLTPLVQRGGCGRDRQVRRPKPR